jgi:Zn-dependent protease
MQQYTHIQLIAIWALPVLLAITVHEVSHGYVAHKLGDNTAYAQGRLTLNPFKHIDLIGTIIVPIVLLITTNFIFGWAKPVPVQMRNLRKPIRDMAIVAAAGPISNFVMAICWAIIMKFGLMMIQRDVAVGIPILEMGKAGIIINLLLGILNLIPIPPLDGSRVISSLLPTRAYILYNRLEPVGFFILLGLMIFGAFSYIISPPFEYCYRFLVSLIVGV